VLPARYEVWGLVVNEALAHGIPVVATDRVGAVDDLISDGVNGVVVESGSASALTAGMARLATWTPEALARSQDYSREVLAGWTIDEAARGIVRAARLAADARTTIPAT
jgi:glycosyltransferase involved in cell wall biosynthesis